MAVDSGNRHFPGCHFRAARRRPAWIAVPFARLLGDEHFLPDHSRLGGLLFSEIGLRRNAPARHGLDRRDRRNRGSIGLCFIYTALRQRATGPVVTLSSMSILVPILFALALGWDVPLGPVQALGSILTIIGTIAIHAGRSSRPEGERYHWIGLAIGALLCFGFSQAAQKYITVIHPNKETLSVQVALANRYVFMATYYLAGGLALFLYLLSTRQSLQRRALPYAFLLSLSSVCQFICMLTLLQHVSTARVYITFSGGGSILILFASAWLLHERYSSKVWIGCLLGITGIVLMRL